MPRFNIEFIVNGKTQTITAANNKKIRAGSKNYWYATFNFIDNCFEGLEYLSASFAKKPYSPNRTDAIVVPIVNGECQIPWEVLTRKRKIYIGVSAGDMLVTDEAVVEVTEAAPTAGIYTEPTSSWFNIFLDELATKQNTLIAGNNIEISADNEISAILTNAVLYSEQTLTEEEKSQARTNIGAGTAEVFWVEFTATSQYTYEMVTPYEDLLNALREEKTPCCIIHNYDNTSYILHNFYNSEDYSFFWDIINSSDSSIGQFIRIDFSHSDHSIIGNPILTRSEIASIGNIPQNVVKYTLQRLDEDEKRRARLNIGAGTDETIELIFELEHGRDEDIITMVSDYDQYVSAMLAGSPMCAVIYDTSELSALPEILYGFTPVQNGVYFWTIRPDSILKGSIGNLRYLYVYDTGSSVVCYPIKEAPLVDGQAIDEELNKKAPVIEREIIDGNDVGGVINVELVGDRVYWLINEISEININLEENYTEQDKLYHFYYVAGANAPQISFPQDVGYAPGAMEALSSVNTLVEVSISEVPTFYVNGREINYLAYIGHMETEVW